MLNKCLYFRLRTKHNTKYLFCVKEGCKGQINAEKCYMCPYKEYKKVKSIKKVSKKKIKVSHETYMKVYNRDNGMCQMCGTRENIHCHHVLYRSQRRDLIDEPSNMILLCEEHHRLVHSNKKLYQPMLLEMMEGKNAI